MRNQPFTLSMPRRRTTPIVFASPHSGRDYGRVFRRASVLGLRALRSSEDAFVDQLFSFAPSLGAPLLCAVRPRAFVDLNRGRDELDPALIEGVSGQAGNPRVACGLGVIPRVVSGGREIYRGKLSRAEAEHRLGDVWDPYHRELARLLEDSHAKFGQAVLLDCHSMPHDALKSLWHGPAPLPEVVLGDRYGSSACAAIVDHVEAAFTRAGFRVARNKPFAGAYTTVRYGRPSHGWHVIQIEIDRALYMNEGRISPNGCFDHIRQRLGAAMADIISAHGLNQPLAAE